MAYYREAVLKGIRETEPGLLTLSVRHDKSDPPEELVVRAREVERKLAIGESVMVVYGPAGASELILGRDHVHRLRCRPDCSRSVVWIVGG